MRLLERWLNGNNGATRVLDSAGMRSPSLIVAAPTSHFRGHCFSPLAGFIPTFAAALMREIAYRLSLNGLQIRYLPQASGRHILRKLTPAILLDSENAGAAYVKMYQRYPAIVRGTPLGGFAGVRRAEKFCRGVLLALNIPPRFMAFGARLLPNIFARKRLYSLIHRYAFWRGARNAMGSELWNQLTRRLPSISPHAGWPAV